ncbi:hypothetical protein FKM82_024741 [Ascaphus truei]
MYDNCYERMSTARMEDPRGADSPKWQPEADGESTRGVRPTEEQAVADMSFTSLLWNGAKAVAAPFWSILGPPGTTLEDSIEDIVIGADGNEFQNGGSRFPGRPRGPRGVASNYAPWTPADPGTGALTAQLPEVIPAAGVACKKEWYFARKAAERKRLELAAKEEPHPVGDKGAKAVTAATRTERGAALIKGHPIPLWDPPIISTRGSGFQLCPVGMNPAEQGTGEPAAPLQNVIPVICALLVRERIKRLSKFGRGWRQIRIGARVLARNLKPRPPGL